MNLITLNNDPIKHNLYPFTLTRSILDIRIGIFTLREKWKLFGYEIEINNNDGSLPANIIPSKQIIEDLKKNDLQSVLSSAKKIEYPWDIFRLNDEMIRQDHLLITQGKKAKPISSTNKLISPENIFIEDGAMIEHCILNASTGPIYIGKNAEIMEGSMIRGPFALCENSVVKMGSKIYGATTVGKNCIAGGEIKNSVIGDNSNKSHDGYLGDSVIGEWCNIGAGTSNSNIKNTGNDVMVWYNSSNQFINAGSKCGLIMGDYSRCAINTSFNTGTVVGVCCNVFGDGLTPKNIRNFSWGSGGSVYEFDKAIKGIGNWKKFKKQSIADAEIQTLKHIFEHSKQNNK
jgi:UDP-N-acetylglucosamine diphosphorylase / glucose-1-phosphate thymidylyltransferase / UDP-N-acetylgalactosamine diphosphorylase / glucosamine-1-phosphate N-acetyltransferase / galactosamine-1-phosphate N-acetyltransferase